MAETVKIKSFANGLNIILSEGAEFEEIRQEVAKKFSEGRVFFGNTSVAISFEGRKLSEDEENILLATLRINCDLNVICVVGHDEKADKFYIKAVEQVMSKLERDENAVIYKGTLKDSDVLDTESDVIILGDVYPGCSVSSRGSIIVIGGLYGEAYAGVEGDEKAYVYALEMAPEKLKIGDFKYRSREKKSKWGVRPKVQPKIAYLKDETVIAENYTKELLASL